MEHSSLGEFTKMAATIGPASAAPEILDALLAEGVDCIRINASHIKPPELATWVDRVRASSKRMDRHVAVALDLPGIKFRIGDLDEPLHLKEGETVRLGRKGKGRIPVKLSRLRPYVKKGSDIFLRDGFMRLLVTRVSKEEIVATVVRDGELVSRSGINLPGVSVSEQVPTRRDREFIKAGLEAGVDVFALSFVRSAKDVLRARKLVNGVPLVAKIERPEAVTNIEEIAGFADGLMVARGDLAVECAPEQLPVLQKRIVAAGNRARKVVIVATEMLASMVTNPRPTRAELTDVGNAVLDGCDAAMLSNETAIGHDPVRAVRYLKRIIRTVEQSLLIYDLPRARPSHSPAGRVDWAVTDAVADTALSIGARAIIAFTGSGRTARLLSAKRPSVPIYSFSPNPEVRRRCALMWGVFADGTRAYLDINEQIDRTLIYLCKKGLLKKGDRVVVSYGSPIWVSGTTTNSMRIGEA
ncbi:MAG: pyruvate kinase [Planctomycetota bacterium]|jgi:pyruvate kinase